MSELDSTKSGSKAEGLFDCLMDVFLIDQLLNFLDTLRP